MRRFSEIHRNIPVFIPHMGCPHNCLFCDQHLITNQPDFREETVRKTIETALQTMPDDADVEIAFFGGSFTGIDRQLMIRLLETAYDYITIGKVSSIRLSTRPDYIDDEILTILSRYGVRHIELGVQSMDEQVLRAVRRGHSPTDAERACRLIGSYGFVLGGQMMIGLPGSTADAERRSAEILCQLGIREARIYPTVILKGTGLHRLAEAGRYEPPSVDEMVSRGADVLEILCRNGVKVLRIGLQSGDGLTPERIYGGTYHPAIGEMIAGEVLFRRMAEQLDGRKTDRKDVVFAIPRGRLSTAIGHAGRVRKQLTDTYRLHRITFVEEDIAPYSCRLLAVDEANAFRSANPGMTG